MFKLKKKFFFLHSTLNKYFFLPKAEDETLEDYPAWDTNESDNTMLEPIENCDKCYTEHLDHQYLRINVQALQDLTNARNFEKVFFILNGNNQEHKYAASFLAANLGKNMKILIKINNHLL